jgi:RimJ/RimL family protein N-acetyltransferase
MKIPPQAPCLSDGTVSLRPHRPADLDDLITLSLGCRWPDGGLPATDQEALRWMDGGSTGPGTVEVRWALERAGRHLGVLLLRPDGAGAAEVRCALAPSARGSGTMSRALRLALPWAFSSLDLQVVHARAAVGDWDAFRLGWAIGFRLEGTVRGLLPGPEDRRDAWIGSLRRGDALTPSGVWLQPPLLGDHHVLLRPHRAQDAKRIAQACNDSQTQHWLPLLPAPYTEQNSLAHLTEIQTHHATGQCLYWAICDPATNRMTGEIGLFAMNTSCMRKAEVGYWCHPAERGRGLTTRAVRAVARYALLPRDVGGLDLGRLVIQVCRDNRPSRAVASGSGFRQVGVERGAQILRNGNLQDIIRYDLLSHELPEAQDDARPCPFRLPLDGPTGRTDAGGPR